MKFLFALIIALHFGSVFCQTSIDSTLSKKISLSGFTLCKTNLNDLYKLSSDFKLVEVEEMDTPKNCYAHDSRYVNGKGYYSDSHSGLVFQKEENSDYISKIRLTKQFKGKLPNGAYIDLSNLKLKDVFLIYPKFTDSWGSRGCSDYWKFSNDTISFFVKIDKSIQPQFPIKEEFYLDKPIEAVDLLMSCYRIFHKPTNLFKEPINEPMFFLDSIQVNSGLLKNYDPNEIAIVTVYKDDKAIKIAGSKGKNGVIYLTTKDFARNKYWNFFKSKSSNYSKAVPTLEMERNVVYILNNKVLDKNFESHLLS